MTGTAMLRTWRNSPRLFSDFNTLQFANVMAMVAFVLLIVCMAVFPMRPHGFGVALPRVSHAVRIEVPDDEDEMVVSVMRNGDIYFESSRQSPQLLSPNMLPDRMQELMQYHIVERRVLIRADAYARWGTVKEVLDRVHFAGVLRVTFLVD